MHYKNGRLAQEGDPVITTGYSGPVTVGKIHSLVPTKSCNCTVAEPIMGGVQQLTCRTVGDMLHAADALAAFNGAVNVPTPAMPTVPEPAVPCCGSGCKPPESTAPAGEAATPA